MNAHPSPVPVPTGVGYELFPVLDRSWPADGIGAIATIVAQLPDPSELPAGTVLRVRASSKPSRGLRRVLQSAVALVRKPRSAHACVRCTALLARGYTAIGAAADPRTGEEIVWGVAGLSPEQAFTFAQSAEAR